MNERKNLVAASRKIRPNNITKKLRGSSELLFCCCFAKESVLEFLDLGFLATQAAQIIDARFADVTSLVELDVLDHGGGDGETSFHANVIGNLADGESTNLALAAALQDDALELLQTLFLSFYNLVGHRDGVTCLELRKIFYNNLIFNELD